MPQELYQELIDRLGRLRARREGLALRIGLARASSIVLVIILIALALEAIFHLPTTGRTILFWSSFSVILAAFSFLAFPPLLEKTGIIPRISDEALAKKIGKHFTEVEDRLLNVFQLSHSLARAETSSARFAEAAFAGTYGSVRHLDFNAILDEKPFRRSLVFLLFSTLLVAGLLTGFHNDLFGAADRLIHHRTFYQKPAPFVFALEPRSGKMLRGESLRIRVTTSGEQLQAINLHLKEEGAKEFDKVELRAKPAANSRTGNTQNEFIYEFRLQHKMEYYAEAREIESDHYAIEVLDRPLVRSLTLGVIPPSYTHEPPHKLDENLGDVTGLIGTKLDLNIASSKDLLSARIVFTPRSEENIVAADSLKENNVKQEQKNAPDIFQLQAAGLSASGSLILRKSGSYHIELLDKDSLWSEHPIEYTVTLSADESPLVALIDPGERADIPGNMHLPMLAKIHDDFGFSKLRIGYRLKASKYVPEEKEYKWFDLPLSNYNTQDLEVPYVWNLAKIDLSPEDELAYILEVADNDIVSGPKKARTPEFLLRFPSVDEIFKRADEQASEAEKNLKEIKQDAEELKRKIDETVDEMRQTKTSEIGKKQQDFSQRKDVEDVMKRQAELNNRISDVKKDLDQMTKQLDEQHAISPETMQKYQELQKLMQEVRTPELEEAFRKLDQAMHNMDNKAMLEAMKKVQTNEEQFKKSIERTANLLKKIKMEQKLDEMMKRSSELAKNQEQSAKDQEDIASGKKQSSQEEKTQDERKQQDAMNELSRLQEESKDLAKDMQKLPENMQAPEEMKAAMESANDPSTEQAMEDAKDAAKNNQNKRASGRHKDAAQKLKQTRNKMQQLKQKLDETEKKRTLAELKRMRDEMNRLSKEEEKLKKKSQQAMPNSNVFRDYAAEQSDRREELGNTASDMFQLAQHSTAVTPEMGKSIGEAYNNMMQAQSAMTERDQQNSSQNAQGAMTALNKAMQETESSMQAMQNGSSCPNGSGENPGEGQPGGDPFGGGQGSAMQQFLNAINTSADQQNSLNEQMKQMMNGQPSSGGSEREMMDRQAQAARMIANQQGIQKSLEDLAREQKESGEGNKKAAEDVKKIAEEMQELISDMRTKGVRPETIQRQERILSRLLEAQRSVHERDKEETREAAPGENMAKSSPNDLKLGSDDSRRAIREEMMRAKDGGYSKDYQILIRKYLEKLGK